MAWGRFRASFFTVFLRPSVDMYLLLVLMVAGMDPVQVPTFSEKMNKHKKNRIDLGGGPKNWKSWKTEKNWKNNNFRIDLGGGPKNWKN